MLRSGSRLRRDDVWFEIWFLCGGWCGWTGKGLSLSTEISVYLGMDGEECMVCLWDLGAHGEGDDDVTFGG